MVDGGWQLDGRIARGSTIERCVRRICLTPGQKYRDQNDRLAENIFQNAGGLLS
jgi:hypothetical protein